MAKTKDAAKADTKNAAETGKAEEIDKDSKKYKFYSGNGGMNFPNKLTIIRVILIPVFILFFYLPFAGHYFVALAVFIISTLTDMADGKIARRYNLITDFGKLLDPIADKVLVLSAFVLFLSDANIFYESHFGSWGLILAGIGIVLIIAREIMVAGFRLVAADKGVAIAADMFGKIKTVTQYISIFVILFGTGMMNVASSSSTVAYSIGLYFNYLGFAVLMLAVIFTVISGVNYIIANIEIFKAPEKPHAADAAAALADPMKPYMRPALALLSSPAAATAAPAADSTAGSAADSTASADASSEGTEAAPAASAVSLKEVMECAKMANIKPGVLTFALGKTEQGEPICPNLTNLQHILIAGDDPAGTENLMHSLILSLVYRLGPKELKIMLISCGTDALDAYKGLPHLQAGIIHDPAEAIGELTLLEREADRRQEAFKSVSGKRAQVRNIEEYNRQLEPGAERMPRILVVIADLSKLMQTSASLTESNIVALLNTAKACGIHFVIASSDASAAGIPGPVKASIYTRIAFHTPAAEGSGFIIERAGAEGLAPGDMLYKGNSVADPVLIHGCAATAAEASAVSACIARANK